MRKGQRMLAQYRILNVWIQTICIDSPYGMVCVHSSLKPLKLFGDAVPAAGLTEITVATCVSCASGPSCWVACQ